VADQHPFIESLAIEAQALGFSLWGIAPAIAPRGYHDLIRWIEAGYSADMTYFEERIEAYGNLNRVLENVRSVIVLAFPYATVSPTLPRGLQARVARYAWGTADYHDLIHLRLKRLKAFIANSFPDAQSRGVVDSAPIMEREFAQLAGLGWTGKNTLLISPRQGSYFFLSCLLTTVDLPPSTPQQTDHCGTCTRCLDACPTQAFVAPGVLDSRRCISYHTIENRSDIPRELRSGMGQWLFGCDVCQEVCPWNRFEVEANDETLWPRADADPVELIDLLTLNEDQFREKFRKTPLWRPRRRGILRNAAICLGNARDARAVEPLTQLLYDPEPLIRVATVWALGQIGDASGLKAIADLANQEQDASVLHEIRLTLADAGHLGMPQQ
jgi:epoxyqueuosine reductase